MNTNNKRTENKQCTIPSIMLSCGWTDKLTTKKYGSSADIYVEHIDNIDRKLNEMNYKREVKGFHEFPDHEGSSTLCEL